MTPPLLKLIRRQARKRKRQDHELIAELIKPFDIIAVQEVMSDLWGIREIMESLNEPFKMVITDVGGNSERLVYIYDSSRVKTRELFAEIAIPESDRKKYDPPDIPRKFKGFNRNPFLVSFERNEFCFILANVHIYFGRVSGVEYMNRLVEVYALAKWADDQRRSKTTYDRRYERSKDGPVRSGLHPTNQIWLRTHELVYQGRNESLWNRPLRSDCNISRN